MNKELEHKIYKLAYEIHLEDVKTTKFGNKGRPTNEDAWELFGMCRNINDAIIKLNLNYSLEHVLEFMKLMPKGKTIHEYWWSCKDTNKTRIKKYKHLLKVTE